MPKISRENTLVRKVSLVVISTAEKKIAKTQAFDWLRFSISQRSRNEFNYTRRREIFRRETFQTDHVAHAFKLFARNFSHFARREIDL
jgi:hypothetical protein